MTQAICFSCGASKFGALTPCPECEVQPQSESDIALALRLTDHFLNAEELAENARLIREEGARLAIPPEEEEVMIRGVQEGNRIFADIFGMDVTEIGTPRPFYVLDSTQAADYMMPQRCARCGVDQPEETGKIVKQENDRPVRFIWERTNKLLLTVPACTACKRALNRHTRSTSFLMWGFGLLLVLAIFALLPDSIFWGIKLLIVYWLWALGSRALIKLYKRFDHDPRGATWPDLCSYNDGGLTFREPAFHREFLQLNEGTQ